eukprot:CAMPEP_0172769014 /NCGR_PEP_ID=MMETSP1074-20121228/185843_1 /TAXON_ID=2916 /ORGANISM="Ceratium fusus, Strain PA161109" /LENGTH=155 /DNA_ID=CAMNT_0013604517 /DNA_START=92 /DNA_END=558 /DNA_ORIENTATION=-
MNSTNFTYDCLKICVLQGTEQFINDKVPHEELEEVMPPRRERLGLAVVWIETSPPCLGTPLRSVATCIVSGCNSQLHAQVVETMAFSWAISDSSSPQNRRHEASHKVFGAARMSSEYGNPGTTPGQAGQHSSLAMSRPRCLPYSQTMPPIHQEQG